MSDKFIQKTNTFTLFRNNEKQSETHADFNGTINVDGVEYWINAWEKNGKNGTFFSGSIKLKQKKEAQKQASKPVDDPFNDDLTF